MPLSTQNLLFHERDDFLQSPFSQNNLMHFLWHFHRTLLCCALQKVMVFHLSSKLSAFASSQVGLLVQRLCWQILHNKNINLHGAYFWSGQSCVKFMSQEKSQNPKKGQNQWKLCFSFFFEDCDASDHTCYQAHRSQGIHVVGNTAQNKLSFVLSEGQTHKFLKNSTEKLNSA